MKTEINQKAEVQLWTSALFYVDRKTFTGQQYIPMESIAKTMGHASISSTQIYAQITDQKIARGMDMLIEENPNQDKASVISP